MAKYRFQFKTGNFQHGSQEIKVKNFEAEIEGEINRGMTLLIEAHGGRLVEEKPTKSKAKKRKIVNPVKWDENDKVGEK